MNRRKTALQESARRILWQDREVLLPHVIEHRCPVGQAVEDLCRQAGWEYLSYLTAAVFNDASLIVIQPW